MVASILYSWVLSILLQVHIPGDGYSKHYYSDRYTSTNINIAYKECTNAGSAFYAAHNHPPQTLVTWVCRRG